MSRRVVLSGASCEVFLEGGSRAKIPFLPVGNARTAPMGTEGYARDVDVSAPIVFAGNGIVREGGPDAYGAIDVAGKVVLFGYDAPDGAGQAPDVSFEDRVRAAAARGAAAVVVFSFREEAPFPVFREHDAERIPEVPVIAINRRSAERILAAGSV